MVAMEAPRHLQEDHIALLYLATGPCGVGQGRPRARGDEGRQAHILAAPQDQPPVGGSRYVVLGLSLRDGRDSLPGALRSRERSPPDVLDLPRRFDQPGALHRARAVDQLGLREQPPQFEIAPRGEEPGVLLHSHPLLGQPHLPKGLRRALHRILRIQDGAPLIHPRQGPDVRFLQPPSEHHRIALGGDYEALVGVIAGSLIPGQVVDVLRSVTQHGVHALLCHVHSHLPQPLPIFLQREPKLFLIFHRSTLSSRPHGRHSSVETAPVKLA